MTFALFLLSADENNYFRANPNFFPPSFKGEGGGNNYLAEKMIDQRANDSSLP
jgi:hypothetical protein